MGLAVNLHNNNNIGKRRKLEVAETKQLDVAPLLLIESRHA